MLHKVNHTTDLHGILNYTLPELRRSHNVCLLSFYYCELCRGPFKKTFGNHAKKPCSLCYAQGIYNETVQLLPNAKLLENHAQHILDIAAFTLSRN